MTIELQREVKTARVALTSLGSGITEQFDLLVEYLTSAKLTFCFDWHTLSHAPMDQRDYARCLSQIKAFIKHRSVSIIPSTTGIDEDTIVLTLSSYKDDQKNDYLLKIARDIYDQRIPDFEVSNYIKYIVGVNALFYMIQQYPENYKTLKEDYLFGKNGLIGQLIEHGESVGETIGSLKSSRSYGKNVSNRGFFDKLVSDYEGTLKSIEDKITALHAKKDDWRKQFTGKGALHHYFDWTNSTSSPETIDDDTPWDFTKSLS